MEDSAALRRLQNPTVIPTIDFTQHTMDDGRLVNTQERVIKGKHQNHLSPLISR
jgi:serine/threonine-protein phosphatase 2B catalytic subunit